MNILFVCTGNTCRSPMAEGYLKSLGLENIAVKSCGLAADGSPVSKNSVKALREIGIQLRENHFQIREIQTVLKREIPPSSPISPSFIKWPKIKGNKIHLRILNF